jgi:hypothetical protein
MLLRRVVTAGLLLTGFCLGCAEPAPARLNLLFISIDALRADRLGAWGYGRATSPHIDGLAREAVVFENAQAQSSWTLPTLASVMTSLYSSTHRCWSLFDRLGEAYETLAERLHAEGWKTAAVASHLYLSRRYGLHQGFESYDESLVEETLAKSHEAITSPQVTEKGLRWLAERRDEAEPWFLWLHYFDPHALYLAHEDVSATSTTVRSPSPTGRSGACWPDSRSWAWRSARWWSCSRITARSSATTEGSPTATACTASCSTFRSSSALRALRRAACRSPCARST